MYVTTLLQPPVALTAETGEIYWALRPSAARSGGHEAVLRLREPGCCDQWRSGVDGHVGCEDGAFHRLTGEKIWEVTLAEHDDGFSATSVPMIVKDMAIIGIAGRRVRRARFFDAYDVETGELRWRHYTVQWKASPGVETWAGDSWKTGGAPAWTSGAYDPEADVLYWTTGNPSPDWNGDLRAGDNLYSNSLLAVNPDTGERLWHFQFTPPTTCGTTTATRRSFWSTSNATARPSQPSCKLTATASSTSLDRKSGALHRRQHLRRGSQLGHARRQWPPRWWIPEQRPPRSRTSAFAPATWAA